MCRGCESKLSFKFLSEQTRFATERRFWMESEENEKLEKWMDSQSEEFETLQEE
jgi:hypothetical protein